ncbi:MAG: hypothetical protein WAN50_03290, partial [Minisyncoccia bacterium]
MDAVIRRVVRRTDLAEPGGLVVGAIPVPGRHTGPTPRLPLSPAASDAAAQALSAASQNAPNRAGAFLSMSCMGVLTPPSAAIDAAERCEYAATSNANSETRPLGPYEQHGDMNAGRDVLGAIQEAIRHNTVQLQQRAERGELLVVEDLLENVPDLPDETQIFCVDGKLSSDPAEFPSEHLSPGLSFLWTSTGLEKFVSNTNLQKSISEFRLFRKHEQICIGAASYLYTPNDSSIAAIVDMLSFSVAILSKYSLNALNKSREPLDALRRELILAVEDASGRFGLSDLAVFLKQKTQIDFGLIHLAKSRAAPSVRTITVSARLQPTFFVLLSEFLGVSRELFDGDSECVT